MTASVRVLRCGDLRGGPHHARCKHCGHRWRPRPSDPLPGKDLACPVCGLDGATVVLDFEPQTVLDLEMPETGEAAP